MDHRPESGVNCDQRLFARVPAQIRPSIVDMVRRVVGRFRPDRIVLFGSQARGDARAGSDVDLLVVLPVDGSRRETRLAIRMLLGDLPVPIDVLVVTPREWRMQRDIPGTVVWPARREGIVLYERRRVGFPKTHSIRQLVRMLPDETPAILSESEQELLSDYAVVVRYPGEEVHISLRDAEEALNIARRARRCFRTILAED